MDSIVICMRPFVMKQTIKVYKNDECVETVESKNLFDLDSICVNLCSKYNINQIDFHGSHNFGIKLEERLCARYKNNKINFTYY